MNEERRKRNETFAEARRQAIASGAVAAWSVKEMAVAHGISEGYIRKAIREGELPAVRLGRRVILRHDNVAIWLSAHEVKVRGGLLT